MAYFAADFPADFLADFPADFSADFPADFLVDFSADFSADFAADFSVDFAWNCRRIFLRKVPKPCKTMGLSDFLNRIPEKFPHKFSLVVVHGCSLGAQV